MRYGAWPVIVMKREEINMRYKLAYFIIWFRRLFAGNNAFDYYRYTAILEDIIDEGYRYKISKQMNKYWY